MSNLDYAIVKSIEDLFNMETGYVIDFSNNTFKSFVKGVIGIDIYGDENYQEYCSKANKLRQIIEDEPTIKVVKLLKELLIYYEDYKLKNNNLTEYDMKKIKDIRTSLDETIRKNDTKVSIPKDLDDLFKLISTREASFQEMSIDEKLKEIGNLIEYLLKQDGKYKSIDYRLLTSGFLNEDTIKDFRKNLQCFRHSAQNSLNERKSYAKNQKMFFIEFGITICNVIYNEFNDNAE
jgi:hypothetical protein